jgi:YidC/Oxa1 family membrane protein insertase
MDLYSLGPIAAVLDTASGFVLSVADALGPLAGVNSAALAIIVLTLALRAVLVPVGVSQLRAQRVRERLAPTIEALRRRHGKDAHRLQRELAGLYATENASPVAGCLPLLVQAPVLSGVYALFVLPSIAGHANLLLAHNLFGAPLGSSLIAAVGSGAGAAIVVPLVVLVLILAVVLLGRQRTLAQFGEGRGPRALSWLPLVTVAFAVVAPLAATLYILVSTSWTVVERAILPHVLPQ